MDPTELQEIVRSAVAGQPGALQQLLELDSPRLLRLIALRLDQRIAGRVGVEDVLQEVHLVAYRRLHEFAHQSTLPFYLWLRAIAVNKLLEIHRRHLGTKLRDARREAAVQQIHGAEASTSVLAHYFVDSGTSPSNALMRDEMKARLDGCIDQLPATDKEVLALRHFEQLSPTETANVLQISEKAAAMRYTRALRKLKFLLDTQGGSSSAWTLEN